jgi:hypothetical protein
MTVHGTKLAVRDFRSNVGNRGVSGRVMLKLSSSPVAAKSQLRKIAIEIDFAGRNFLV